MSKPDINKTVTFYISTGFVQGKREESFELSEYFSSQEEIDSLTDDEFETKMNENFAEWRSNYDMGWYFKED